MWKKFIMHLGKMVQGALNIFRKKKPQYERGLRAKCNFLEDSSFIGQTVTLNEGEILIDGKSFGKVLGIETIPFDNTDDLCKKLDAYNIPVEISCDKDLQEKLANTYKSLLPKAIEVPTLIVSVFSAQKFDAVGVDLSLLEEKGIAHYFCMSTKTMQEQMDEFRSRHPDYEEWEEESEGASVVVKDAILLEWPGGEWEWFG